jgi:hypothetical protein
MANALHGAQTVADGIHIIQSLEYANAAARTGASLTADDVGRVAHQQDNDTFWLCTDNSPLTWSQIASGAVAAHASTHSDGGSDEITVENLATAGTVGTVPISDGAGGLTMGAPTPAAHASTHSDGGSDEITVENLATAGAVGTVATSDGAGGLSMATPPTAVLTWGAGSVLSSTTTRYLYPGYDDDNAPTSSGIIQWRAPRDGTFRNLRVRHNSTAGNGNNIVYTLRVNGSGSGLAATLASTASDGADTSSTASVSAGDLVDIEVTKASGVGGAPGEVIASVEFV